MLSTVFENIVRMSISASIVIAAVCLVRLLLLRSPRKFCYALWLAVLLRLLCPFTFTAQVEVGPEQLDRELVAMWAEYSAGMDMPEADVTVPEEAVGTERTVEPVSIFSLLWLLGVGVMVVYCGVSLLRLKGSLAAAVPLENEIYIADHIGAPFVVGLLRPKIYMPSDLGEAEREYILAHERHHIRRGDHFAKLLGFAALSLHWFNPLAWVAFRLFVKDMEASCDEAVLGKLGEEVRSDYSQSLLNLAVGRKIPAWTPLAFGEDTRGRIENVLRWRRPSLRRVVSTALVTAVCIGCCFVSVEGVLAESEEAPEMPVLIDIEPAEPGVLSEEVRELELISGGSIVRTPDPNGYESLTEGQVYTLTALLSAVEPEQMGAKSESFESTFVIKLWKSDKEDISIRFGHEGGERCLTVNGYVVEDELLTACVYHIYLSFGTQNLCNENLPEGAVLLHEEHGVHTYEFYCQSCGQMETASVGHDCGCCRWTDYGKLFERLSSPGGYRR